MDWVVFGDDWGRHPSTTQHLVRHLPARDRVVWVDSIGMRSPQLTAVDLRRLAGKLATLGGRPGQQLDPRPPRASFRRVRPAVAPWHLNPFARRLNRRLLTRQIAAAAEDLRMERPVALLSNPVAGLYLSALNARRLVYLRLDDYAALPGVDPTLVARVEPPLIERADLIVTLSRELTRGDQRAKTHYLPQGVDLPHFSTVPLAPPTARVLGYYGSVAPWLDLELITEVARANPSWRLELVGPITIDTAALRRLPNIALLGPAPYAELPRHLARWRAAWLPFIDDPQIQASSSLKLREYLAAGLPVAATHHPEAERLGDVIAFISNPAEVGRWLGAALTTDSAAERLGRRSAVAAHAWELWAEQLRALVAAL